MQCPLSYAPAFEKDYGVRLVGVCIMVTPEDMMFSKFLAASYREAYVRYTRDGKRMITHQGTLSLFVKLGKAAAVARNLGITHLDDPIL